jgi:hypothetical protein
MTSASFTPATDTRSRRKSSSDTELDAESKKKLPSILPALDLASDQSRVLAISDSEPIFLPEMPPLIPISHPTRHSPPKRPATRHFRVEI